MPAIFCRESRLFGAIARKIARKPVSRGQKLCSASQGRFTRQPCHVAAGALSHPGLAGLGRIVPFTSNNPSVHRKTMKARPCVCASSAIVRRGSQALMPTEHEDEEHLSHVVHDVSESGESGPSAGRYAMLQEGLARKITGR
jgi:hypothetical protein